MGHLIQGEVYRNLGKKIDGLQTRTPFNKIFYEILKELYTVEEADIIAKMPYGLSCIEDIARITSYEKIKLNRILDCLCNKGLLMDICIENEYRYMISPIAVGFFELVMMRTGDSISKKRKYAELFHQYMHGDESFYKSNFGNNEKVSIMRTLVHEDSIFPSEYVEILDYEKATSIIERSKKFSIGTCSCRHEKLHVGDKQCAVPLETCSSLGKAADFAIRRNFAREVSKSEMLDNLARSKELKLVFTADNVKNRVNFICHCCGCCCNLLLGITRHGYTNSLVTSSFISKVEINKCTGCGKCASTCPVNAIEIEESHFNASRKTIKINENICIGCGVCGLTCSLKSIGLVKRKQRVIHPEDTFERIILMCLERGTLQNQIFNDPQKLTHKVMRGFFGAFLRLPPVKKALMSDLLRSSFLASVRQGTASQGKAWLFDI